MYWTRKSKYCWSLDGQAFDLPELSAGVSLGALGLNSLGDCVGHNGFVSSHCLIRLIPPLVVDV